MAKLVNDVEKFMKQFKGYKKKAKQADPKGEKAENPIEEKGESKAEEKAEAKQEKAYSK